MSASRLNSVGMPVRELPLRTATCHRLVWNRRVQVALAIPHKLLNQSGQLFDSFDGDWGLAGVAVPFDVLSQRLSLDKTKRPEGRFQGVGCTLQSDQILLSAAILQFLRQLRPLFAEGLNNLSQQVGILAGDSECVLPVGADLRPLVRPWLAIAR